MERPSRPTGGGPDDLTTLLERIDPARFGPRLRAARKAAGLTQAAVAGDAFSSAYVSRIEDSSRGATLRFVEHAASRLGLTPEALVTGLDAAERDRLMAELDRGEFLLSETDSSPAAPIAETVLQALTEADDPRLLRRALRLRAGVREAAGELRAAAADLERVVAEPVADLDWVRDLISLNRCYRDGGELDRAIALEGLFGKEIERFGLHRSTEAIQFTVSVAGALTVRGDLGHAKRLCQRAVAIAEANELHVARASALWNLSIVVQMQGDLTSAIDLAEDALTVFETADDTRNLSRLRNHLADMKIAIDPPDPDGALALLDRVLLEIDWSRAGDLARGKAFLSQARAARLTGDRERSRSSLARSVELVSPDSVTTLADHQRLLAQLAIDDGDLPEAGRRYREAIALLSSVGADVDAAELWFELAGELEAAGETRLALEAYRNAGASRGFRPTPSGTTD